MKNLYLARILRKLLTVCILVYLDIKGSQKYRSRVLTDSILKMDYDSLDSLLGYFGKYNFN